MVTGQTLLLPSNRNHYVLFRLAYQHLSLFDFYYKYLINGIRYGTRYSCHKVASHVLAFNWPIYIRPCPILTANMIKCEDQRHEHFGCKYLLNGHT